MAPRKPPKILLGTDPLAPTADAALPADEAMLLPTPAEAGAPFAEPFAEPAPLAEEAMASLAESAESASEAASEATAEVLDSLHTASLDAAQASAETMVSAGEAITEAITEPMSEATDAVREAMVDPAAMAEAEAPDAGRARARLDAALDVPRLMCGFLERQTRRTMDGAAGLARCRSLPDAMELQGALIRDSMDDFVRSNTDIAFRSLAAITGDAPRSVDPLPSRGFAAYQSCMPGLAAVVALRRHVACHPA